MRSLALTFLTFELHFQNSDGFIFFTLFMDWCSLVSSITNFNQPNYLPQGLPPLFFFSSLHPAPEKITIWMSIHYIDKSLLHEIWTKSLNSCKVSRLWKKPLVFQKQYSDISPILFGQEFILCQKDRLKCVHNEI